MVAYQSPNRMGLITLDGCVVGHARFGRGGKAECRR
jgi:hypothetical protein